MVVVHHPKMNRPASAAAGVTSKAAAALLNLLLVGFSFASAQNLPAASPADPRKIELFADGFFAERMKQLHIPGVVFIVIDDSRIVFAKGYGYADLESRTPVSTDGTLFRVGSISKLFTATAALQLVERGALDLNKDVNQYLSLFKLESSFPRPVTVANLLTHTGGFGEQFIGKAARTPSELIPLGPYLARRMPGRVMPPGEFVSYSNHGYALLGYLVEVVSQVPFAQYIDDNILRPLGMHRSSFQQPPPAHLARDVAQGYVFENGSYRPVPLDYLNDAPAGSLITTATDIARFMIAHLRSDRALGETTANQMHRRQFTAHPGLPGVCYGFWEQFQNNRRAISHDGGWTGFYSLLFLLPDEKRGFFVAANSLDLQNPSQQAFGEDLIHEFVDRYYPVREKPAPPKPLTDSSKRTRRLVGSYRSRIPPQHTFEKIISLFTQARVTLSDDGSLTVSSLFSGPTKWVEIEPGLFQRVGAEEHMAFRADENGQITHMLRPEALEKLPWYASTVVQSGLIAFFLLVFLSPLVIWPGGDLLRRLSKVPRLQAPLGRPGRRLAALVCSGNLLFLIGFSLLLQSYPTLIWYGVPAKVTALLLIPILTTALTLGLPIFAATAWKNKSLSILGRLHYSLITLAAVLFIPFLIYWNLFGLHY